MCCACGWEQELISQSASRNNQILVGALATASSALATVLPCTASGVTLARQHGKISQRKGEPHLHMAVRLYYEVRHFLKFLRGLFNLRNI